MSNNKYQSRYSPKKQVSAAQFITELICEKKAAKDGIDLPVNFWKLPKWGAFFRQQIVTANGLLRIYSDAAIVRALRSPKAFSIFSLRAPHLDAIIKEEQLAVDGIEKRRSLDQNLVKPILPAQPIVREKYIKKTSLDKLRALDGEEEERN